MVQAGVEPATLALLRTASEAGFNPATLALLNDTDEYCEIGVAISIHNCISTTLYQLSYRTVARSYSMYSYRTFSLIHL